MLNRSLHLLHYSRVVWGYVQFYVCITVSVKVRAESDSYSDYQKKLFNKIKRLKKKGLGYRKIAHYLNSKNIKTTRGKEFKNSHVYSILKKGFKRHKRLIKKLDMIIENVYIEYPKKKTKFGLKVYS